jgi:hypothetical protein
MGYYIQTESEKAKANQLVATRGATMLLSAPKWEDIPPDKALICVVDNGPFEAAGLVYSKNELEDFSETRTSRRRWWLYMDKPLAYKLANYKQ